MQFIEAKEGFIKDLEEDVPYLFMLTRLPFCMPSTAHFEVGFRQGDQILSQGMIHQGSTYFPALSLSDRERSIHLRHIKAYTKICLEDFNAQLRQRNVSGS